MKNVIMNHPKFTLSVLTLALLTSATVHAAPLPSQPDAGQVTRELQKPADLAPPKTVAPLRVEGEAAPQGAPNSAVRFAVTSIRVTGSNVFPAAELEALVATLDAKA